jgi:predicted transcriptional regulator
MGWKTVCFKLEEDVAIEFYQIAQRNNKQISDILRELVRKYVEMEKLKHVDWDPKIPRKIRVY